MFIVLTSDGKAYIARWGRTASSLYPVETNSDLPPINDQRNERLLFDEKSELEKEAAEEEWIWSGECFHMNNDSFDVDGNDLNWEKAGSCLAVNEKMALVAVGCEK